MVKAFMDPITAAKIEVHHGVPMERFRALMDDATLPSEYGGSNATLPQTRLWGREQLSGGGESVSVE